MKSSIKYLAVASAVVLALAGCDNKKQKPAKATNEDTPAVVEQTLLACDDSSLQTRVTSIVREELVRTSLDSLDGLPNIKDLENLVRDKLSNLPIETQNASGKDGECTAQLHVVFSESDVALANDVFAQAGLPSLEEQAISEKISLMGGHRLVGNLSYKLDGESLNVDKSNNIMALASDGIAKAVYAIAKQQGLDTPKPADEPTTDKDTPASPKVVTRPAPPPTPAVQPRPATPTAQPKPAQSSTSSQATAERPKTTVTPPKPSVAPSQPSTAKPATTSSTRAEAPKQQPAERPKAEPKATPKPETKTTPTPTPPKPEPKPEPKPAPKPEAKPAPAPKAEPKPAPVVDESSQITIVETDETY